MRCPMRERALGGEPNHLAENAKSRFHGDMNEPRPPSFLARVRAELPHMHPTQRRLAEFLLSFPGELASYTASELARLANVSNATVSRFVQRLGYESYEDARRHVRAERKTGAAIFMVASEAAAPAETLRLHLEQAEANLRNTFHNVSLEEIDRLAGAMLAARRVWIVGFRSSHFFAVYLHWQVFQVIEQVSVLPRAGQTLAEHIAGMRPEDCVIVFGLPRRIRGTDAILEQIARTGARLAYVTDEGVERLAAATWHFRCQTAAPGPLFSHVSVLGIVHLLATRAIELAGPKARKRLSVIESLHDALEEL